MKQFLLLLFSIAFGCAVACAQYSVHSVEGNVTLKKGLQTIKVVKGLTLSPSDMLDLGEGAQIEIFNSANSQTYKCSQTGMTSVSGIMIRAKSLAGNKGKSIRDNMNFSRTSGSGTGHVYVESGMVKRSMATYDPDAKNIEVDPKVLSIAVISALKDPSGVKVTECPATFTHAANADGGLGFSIGNTLSSPIYFNVLKVSGDSLGGVSISELGQPSGSYVLLPSQTISREQLSPMKTGERHILIMTNFNFDIDKLIEHIEHIIKSGEDTQSPDSSLNVFISAI